MEDTYWGRRERAPLGRGTTRTSPPAKHRLTPLYIEESAGQSEAANTVNRFCGHYSFCSHAPQALILMTRSVSANFAPHFAPSPSDIYTVFSHCFLNRRSHVRFTPRVPKYGFTTIEFTSGVTQSQRPTQGLLG